MEGGYPDVTPVEKYGRALSRVMGEASGGIIDYDTDLLVEQAGKWQGQAEYLRSIAARGVIITKAADAGAGGFRDEYEPSGEYNSTYSSCLLGCEIAEQEINKAADSLEQWAQAVAWMAKNMDEAQAVAAGNMSDIDSDLSARSKDGPSGDTVPAPPPAPRPNTVHVSDTSVDLEDFAEKVQEA